MQWYPHPHPRYRRARCWRCVGPKEGWRDNGGPTEQNTRIYFETVLKLGERIQMYSHLAWSLLIHSDLCVDLQRKLPRANPLLSTTALSPSSLLPSLSDYAATRNVSRKERTDDEARRKDKQTKPNKRKRENLRVPHSEEESRSWTHGFHEQQHAGWIYGQTYCKCK